MRYRDSQFYKLTDAKFLELLEKIKIKEDMACLEQVRLYCRPASAAEFLLSSDSKVMSIYGSQQCLDRCKAAIIQVHLQGGKACPTLDDLSTRWQLNSPSTTDSEQSSRSASPCPSQSLVTGEALISDASSLYSREGDQTRKVVVTSNDKLHAFLAKAQSACSSSILGRYKVKLDDKCYKVQKGVFQALRDSGSKNCGLRGCIEFSKGQAEIKPDQDSRDPDRVCGLIIDSLKINLALYVKKHIVADKPSCFAFFCSFFKRSKSTRDMYVAFKSECAESYFDVEVQNKNRSSIR